ncbi:MAG: ribosome maturation factor RimM [Caldimonas sp.]
MAVDLPAFRPADALEVGRIGDAWGLKGWFKVQSYADPPQALLSARRWHLSPASAPQRPLCTAVPATLEISEIRIHGEGLVAVARGIADRDGAEALRGAHIFVGRSSFPAAGADEYYWADLVGLSVVNRSGDELGSIVGLLDTGPHSVLRVQAAEAGADERLIPFVAAYVDTVDLASRRVVVDWGLDY